MTIGGGIFKRSGAKDTTDPTVSAPEKKADLSDGDVSDRVETVDGPPAPRLVDAETEKRLIKKLDRRIIPMIMWMYLMSFMDRVNIGNARVYGLEADLGMAEGSGQYQLAVSILFVTYCLFEAPSNMILKRARPRWYLAGLTMAWGLVATFSGLTQNFAGLVVCRLLLGLFEAGLFPGLVVYLTIFYNKKHIATRNAMLFGTAAIAGAAGGLLNFAIGQIQGPGSWNPWRWIFIINGLLTVVTAPIIPFVLADSPETAKWLSEEDQHNMVLLRQQEIGQSLSAQEFSKKDAREAFTDWKVWSMGAAQFSVNCMLYSFSIFLPTIIRDMNDGWSPAIINLLTIPVHLLGAIIYLAVARYSDKTQIRGPYCMAFNWIAIVGYAMLISNRGVAVSYAGCFLVGIGCYLSVGLPMSWLAANNPRYGKRTTGTGIQLTIGNASGVAAPFLFQDQYEPTYFPGYGGQMGMLVLSSAIYVVVHTYWKSRNKKKQSGKEDHLVQGLSPEEISDAGDRNPKYLFTI